MENQHPLKNIGKLPKVLGVIPARGSSKRFPNKNIRMLAGKPLVAWTIEAAQKANRLTEQNALKGGVGHYQ